MNFARVAVLVFGFVVLQGRAVDAQETARTPAAPESPAPAYIIGPADVLSISVWKEPELTRDVEVRFDGMITVPLLGDVPAAGRTPGELAKTLSKALEQFVATPRVTVGVQRTNTTRFYVLGLVTKAGEYPLTGQTSVLQGLAMAGGFKDFAKTDSIVVIRKDQSVISVNYKRIAEGKDVSQNVRLSPGDTVVVP